MRQIVEHKRKRRIELAALPFPQKVRIVEQMREALTHVKTSGGGTDNACEDQGTKTPERRG